MNYFIIATVQCQLELVKEGLELRHLLERSINEEKFGTRIITCIIPQNIEDARSHFSTLAAQLESLCQQGEVTAIISSLNPLALNPLSDTGREALFGMLILAFPEVTWLFGTLMIPNCFSGNTSFSEKKRKIREVRKFRKLYSLKRLFDPPFNPLFDGSGLRDWVRSCIREDHEAVGAAAYLPCKTHTAIALDEEPDYAAFHAYIAYRFGFRAIAVQTRRLAQHLLGQDAQQRGIEPSLVIEDIFLNFPDGGSGYSDLGGVRWNAFPLLENMRSRIFVTSGQTLHDPRSDDVRAKNRLYLDEQRQRLIQGRHQHIKIIYKPHAGIFRLWEGAGLTYKLPWPSDQATSGLERSGCAPGYVWPPRHQASINSGEASGHSAPGVLLSIATNLLDRAVKLRKEVYGVRDAVRGAVLATEALYLLGGKTPTSSIEALRLRHEFEVLAECQFSGVEHHFHLNPRMQEIRLDTLAISRWFHPSQRKTAALNAEMKILNRLLLIFRDYGQFDEEEMCLNRVRYLQSTLWMRAHPWRWIFWPVIRYVEMLLTSFPRFIFILTVWVCNRLAPSVAITPN